MTAQAHAPVKIGSVALESPFALAPMAGMTDTAFRRLVKRRGGCGLVVTEMVSSEGLVRRIDRTLEYAEYTDEERPVSIQIFGGDPAKMAEAAQIVEGMGADVVDVNMGCPVPKIAKHQAGCSLMRMPEQAASVVRAMTRAVSIPVTVKMRSGWDETHVNALDVAGLMQDAGAAAVAVHGRTAAQSYSGRSDWDLIDEVARSLSIPVLGSGDCVAPEDLVGRLRETAIAGVLVGRGALRNPWIFEQARALGQGSAARPVTEQERGQFLLAYIDMLLSEGTDEAEGFRHTATVDRKAGPARRGVRSRERWVLNKLRALGSWYTKGFDNGSRLRVAMNHTKSLDELRNIIRDFFFVTAESIEMTPTSALDHSAGSRDAGAADQLSPDFGLLTSSSTRPCPDSSRARLSSRRRGTSPSGSRNMPGA
ncbi:MAG: tRNA dihydrouridine synthase DusB [Acidobacteria bacterium]|jgi:tRNA-dihydrouridine synthase B|nr:tRNA dihydrouridine synthase DusB [Acidobacteriota bacterium]HJN44333.1 tRNA dihydrouridine synthase DusB [Vicinamibacterales bacterium]